MLKYLFFILACIGLLLNNVLILFIFTALVLIFLLVSVKEFNLNLF
jgi:hypothetical protein